MEEDLKIVEEFRQELAEIKEKFKNASESLVMQSIIDYRTKQAQAIEHLLQAYKQQKEIIKNSVSKDKIIQLKDFIITDCIQKNIDLIPVSNLIKNMNILLEGDE